MAVEQAGSQAGSQAVVVAGVQMDCRLGDAAANLKALRERAREAAARGARLAVFPECILSGYCFEDAGEARAAAQPVPGPATAALSELARELDLHLVFGLVEAAGERIYNALAQEGTVLMPLEKTFWASRFGQVVDRFGIPWQINCE